MNADEIICLCKANESLREENARLREIAKQNAITADQWKREAERVALASASPTPAQEQGKYPRCTRQEIDCHANDNGVCRNAVVCKPAECPHLWGDDEPCVYPVIKLRHCKLCGVDYTETIEIAKPAEEVRP